MSLSLYDISINNYLQTLGAVSHVLDKGASFAADSGLPVDELTRLRLRDDMADFTFQIISVWHHSLGALRGIQEGLFQPPPKLGEQSYGELQALVAEAATQLQALDPDEVNALADKDMLFKVGQMEVPFTGSNFVLSFSLPNFYFHATTAYDILRVKGVPLGKMDYLGALRASH